MWAMAKVNIARKNEKKFSKVVSSVAVALEVHTALLRVPAVVVVHAEPDFKALSPKRKRNEFKSNLQCILRVQVDVNNNLAVVAVFAISNTSKATAKHPDGPRSSPSRSRSSRG